MDPVIALTHRFSQHRIFSDIRRATQFTSELLEQYGQVSITNSTGKPGDLYDGVGSLYDYDQKKFTRTTSDFTILNPLFRSTYVEQVLNEVQQFAECQMNVKIGRVRMMWLKPKTCYTYHIDPEDFRFHIPLVTNPKCMFIVDDQVYKMPDVGRLYQFRTNKIHTAVNASNEDRFHLVFDTYVK